MRVFSSKKDSTLVGIVDVRSDSVGGALIATSREKLPQILFNVRANIPVQEEFIIEKFTAHIQTALDKVLERMQASKLGRPKQLFCVLGSPWFASQTRTVRYSEPQPFELTKEILNKLVNKEIVKFEQTYFTGRDHQTVEVKNMDIKLNGYRVKRSTSKHVKDLEVSTYISMASRSILDPIREKVKKIYHLNEVEFHTFPFLGFSILRDVALGGREDFVFADINGEVTELSIVRSGVILQTISFPLGAHSIIRKIASSFSTTSVEAESIFTAYKENRLAAHIRKSVDGMIGEIKEEWTKGLNEAINLAAENFMLPNRFVLIGGGEAVPLFSQFMNEKESVQLNPQGKVFSVTILRPEMLKDFYRVRQGSIHDIFIIVETIFVDKLFNKL
jgi:hypothetical protein